MVSFGHCVVCPSVYGFWLPLWYLLAIVLSVRQFTASNYLFGIFWLLCCLSVSLRLLITSLVSFGHCVVCPSVYGFWLPLWYLLAIVLSVRQFTASDYFFGIFWLLCCLSVSLRLLITSYLLAIVLSVRQFTASDYHFGIFWPLCCLSVSLRLLITTLVSFGHCVVCPSVYGFWLPLWYLLAIVCLCLSLWSTASDYHFGIFWPLCCLSVSLRLLITTLVSFGHCVVCPSVYGFWLPLWYLLAIVLSVRQFTASDYHFGIFWPLCCLSVSLRLLITTLVSFGHCVVCPSVYGFWLPLWYLLAIVLSVRQFTASTITTLVRLLITTLVSFGHCVVCPSVYGFWLPLWYLLVIVLSVRQFTASDYHFGIFWPLCCLSVSLRLLITTLGIFWPLCCLSVSLRLLITTTASDYHFGIFWPLCCLSVSLRLLITTLVSFGHCVVCPSVYGFWLPLWYLLAIVLSVRQFTASDYHFGIFWPLCCLSVSLRLLITTLVSFGHCVVCPSVYGFWLPLWYLLAIVLSVRQFTASDYHFGIFWPLCCLSVSLRLLITTLVSFGHCVVCPSVYGLQFTASNYHFGIFWLLCCLSVSLRLLITTLVSFGHCVVCPLIYGFWLPLWYLLAIVLSVRQFTASDYHFGIFKLF